MTIVAEDGRIRSVSPTAEAFIPPGAQTIDGRGRWVTPGFVDVHVHHDEPVYLRKMLALGFTTIHLMPADPPEGLAREFGPQGRHVVIDGDQVNTRFPQIKERLGSDGMLQVDEIAEVYWALHRQPCSAWTLELEVRPHKEAF